MVLLIQTQHLKVARPIFVKILETGRKRVYKRLVSKNVERVQTASFFLCNLVFELLHEGLPEFQIDRRVVLDVFGSACISKGVHCLAVALLAWRDRGDHQGQTVAAKSVLKEPCQR